LRTLRKSGLTVTREQAITVTYDCDNAHTAQRLNYLKATGLRLCLVLNFGKPRLEIQRVAHEL
jgi:hypothetical protein